MIIQTGFLQPTKAQLLQARKRADSSFCTLSDDDFVQHFPTFDGWQRADRGTTLIKMKNVEPHDDPWVNGADEPRARRAIFWLLEGRSNYGRSHIYFGCGKSPIITMKPGDFVIFNDKITHWVMSDRQWIGAASQLQPAPA